MTAITSGKSGNWSDTATWVGGVVPGTGDTVTIINGHTITVDQNTTVGATVAEGHLVIGAYTLSMEGALTIGNGTGKDGKLTFGAGSTLALGANNLILGNCSLASAATSESWATLTGSGNIQTHGTVTTPKQNISPEYVSFQNTGSITFGLGGVTGAITEAVSVQHCVFVGQTSITFGTAGFGTVEIPRNVSYNDFRNVGDMLFQGASGTPTNVPVFSYNTLDGTTALSNFRFNRPNGWNIHHNVLSMRQWEQGPIPLCLVRLAYMTTLS